MVSDRRHMDMQGTEHVAALRRFFNITGETACLYLRARLVLDLTIITTSGLEGGNNVHAVLFDLAENDVAAVQPRGDNGGDEELGAVAVWIAN